MTQWWSVNWKNRSHFALRHPVYTFKAIIRDLLAADERFLASLTGTTASQIRRFLDEPFQERRFFDHLRKAEGPLNRLQAIGADLYAKRVLLQYAIVRAYKPDCIVETGGANCVSSAYLLLDWSGISRARSTRSMWATAPSCLQIRPRDGLSRTDCANAGCCISVMPAKFCRKRLNISALSLSSSTIACTHMSI